jgi:hypothetical protein
MDYRRWVRDLKRFVAGVPALAGEVEHELTVGPPLGRSALEDLGKSLRLEVPRPVARFLAEGSGRCTCHYRWEPTGQQARRLRGVLGRKDVFGQLSLCDSGQLARWQEWCVEGATETGLADEPEDKALWLRAFPFAFMSHGDFLALDLEGGAEDPPVTYLCHDDKSRVLNRSFDDFLVEWSRICYVGPDRYLFEGFFDRTSGYLSGASRKAEALRALFGVEDG